MRKFTLFLVAALVMFICQIAVQAQTTGSLSGTVTDQQGLQTMVALYNVETGKELPSDLFKIDYNAATNAARENQNR